MRRQVALAAIVVALVALFVVESPSPASGEQFPGLNGLIAFTSDRDGNNEIYVMNVDGTRQTRLTTDPAIDWEPSWSPDGTRIAFESTRDGNYEIYVMNADGTGQTRLTTHPAEDRDPSWSPDGSRIAFASDRDRMPFEPEVYVMAADGSDQTRLTTSLVGVSSHQPSWSPDSSRFAFWSRRDGNTDVYVMAADGSGQTPLTTSPARDQDPSWSPDGTRIAFMSERVGRWEIYVMAADGSGQTRLNPRQDSDGQPVWSPDGTRIAFTGSVSADSAPVFVDADIWVMNADGSGAAQLTTAGENFDASWQPNAPPVAEGDTAVTFEESPVTVEVLANDVDPNGDGVQLLSVGAAAHGSTAVSGTAVVYKPEIDFVGTDTFTYTAGDGKGGTAIATVTVAVTDVGSEPPSVTTDPWWGYEGMAAVAAGPGGTVVTVGRTEGGGGPLFGVARYDTDGHLDPSFSGDGHATADIDGRGGSARAVAVAADGTIVVAGTTADACALPFSDGSYRACAAFARFLPDGSLDRSFGDDGTVSAPEGEHGGTEIYDLALQSDGAIVATGVSSNPDVDEFIVLRLRPDGTVEDVDGDGVGDMIRPDFCHYDDRLGRCTAVPTPARWDGLGTSVAVQPDGRIVVAGRATAQITERWELALARFNPDLTPDTTFGDRGTIVTAISRNSVYGADPSVHLVVQPGGSILVGGFVLFEVSDTRRDGRIVLARYTTDGHLDPDGPILHPFGTENGSVGGIALQADGRIVLAGGLGNGPPDYSRDYVLRRFNPDLTVDTTFDGGTMSGRTFGGVVASDVIVLPDGSIVAIGTGEDAPAARHFGVLARYAPSAADGDGVADAEENAGPKGGDGNADGIADATQDNVATLRADGAGTRYVTLASPASTRLLGVSAGPTPTGPPPGVFPLGAIAFTVSGVGPDPIVIDVFYPDVEVNTWFKYGAGGWEPFGAQFRNLTPHHGQLTLQDGGPGDAGTAGDGAIVDPSVPAFVDIDTTPPETTAVLSGTTGTNGWYRTPAVVDLHATDGDSTVTSITYSTTGATVLDETTVPGDTAQLTVPADGITTITFAAADNAGNLEPVRKLEIRVDATAPEVVCGAPGADWSATNVTVPCTAADPTSGLADPADASFGLATTVAVGIETADAQTSSRTIVDAAGNAATAGPIGGIRVDRKGPVVTLTTPADGATYTQNAVIAPVFDCSDGGAGVATCLGAAEVDTSTAGPHTFTVTGTDAVANTTTVTHAYTVTPAGGAADTVAITLTGAISYQASGPLAGGDFTVTRDAKGVRAVSGTGTTGTTTVSLSVSRLPGTSVHVGAVRVTDATRNLSVTTPLFLVPVRTAGPTGATASSTWFTSGRPVQTYRLTWRVDDLN